MATVAPEDAPRSGAKYMDKVEVESEHGPEGFGPVKIFWYEDQVRIQMRHEDRICITGVYIEGTGEDLNIKVGPR